MLLLLGRLPVMVFLFGLTQGYALTFTLSEILYRFALTRCGLDDMPGVQFAPRDCTEASYRFLERWTWSMDVERADDSCVYALQHDGLQLAPFDQYPDEDARLRQVGLDAETWRFWLTSVRSR
jgi:hypothetical protein